MKRALSVLIAILMVVSLVPGFIFTSGAEETQELVTQGLVSRYDGNMNTRKGHDANATVWEDLAGSNDITVAKNASAYFTETAFHVSKKQFTMPKALLDVINGNAFTVELVIGEFIPQGSSYSTLMCNDKNDNFALFLRNAGDYIEVKTNTNDRPKVTGGKEYFANSTITVTFEVGKSCTLYVDGVQIDKTSVTKAVGADGNLIFGHAGSTKLHTTDFKGMRFYNRALTEAEVIQNAKADKNFDENYVPPMPFVDVKQPQTNIIGDIALIEELKSDEQLNKYADAEILPATVILSVNEKMEVLDETGASIGAVNDVLVKLEGIIPAFRPLDAKAGEALTEYVTEVKMQDAFVVSADSAIIKAVREAYPLLRGVLDLTKTYENKTPDEDTVIAIRKAVNTAPCRIAMLPASFSDAEVINRLNNYQVTTWLVSAGTDTESGILTELLSGAYGIVTTDSGLVWSVANNRLSANTMTRIPLNIGHRGYPGGSFPENSLEGAREAYENGANAIEVDIYLTKDGKLAVCHNATTDAMFDKNLTIENSKMSELRELKFKGFEDQNYRMPILDEFFMEFKGKDVIIVVEIKSSKNEIVSVLKEAIDKYDVYDQCYIITFSRTGIFEELMDVLPEVPVGYLTDSTNSLSGTDALKAPLSSIQQYNTTYNPSRSGYTAEFTRLSVLRGMMTNPWTINSESEIYTFLSYGHSSITTNYCNFIGALKKKIALSVEDGTKVEPGSELAYTVTATTWARAEMNVTGACKLEILEGEDLVKIQGGKLTFGENEGKVVLLTSYTAKMGSESYTLYEQPVEITIEKPKAPTSEENIDKELPPDHFTGPFDGPTGKVLLIGLAAAAALIVAAVVIAVVLKKKKH